jgi:hypothetical protein
VSSLFSLQQISYFNSFVEQVRSADKDGRRQLVAFIADETLKALDGTSTHLLTRVGRSAYLKVRHTLTYANIADPDPRTFVNGFGRESAKPSKSMAMAIVGKDGRSTTD